MPRSRKGDTFRARRAATSALAIRPQAAGLFWLFGLGCDNENRGNVTIVTVDGPLEQRASWWDGYDAVLERFKAACAEESTDTIVLRLSSPGGDAAGCFEAVRMMREAAAEAGKRVVSYADESAYSAAYALACVADEIYLPASGGVGSVGVIAECLDIVGMNERLGINVVVVHAGERKADNHPDAPLTDEAIAGVQHDVDTLAELFAELVGSARGMSAGAVLGLEAACFMGDEAIAVDLADGVMGFDELLEMLGEEKKTNAAESAPNEGKEAMSAKSNETRTASPGCVRTDSLDANDVLAKPQVRSPSVAQLAPQAAALAGADGAPVPAPGAYQKDEKHETVETTTEENEDGSKTDKTTTTTTESTTTKADDEDDDEDDDDDEEEPSSSSPSAKVHAPAPAAAVPVPAPGVTAPARQRASSAEVLRLVKELTGESSPDAQIGSLTRLSELATSATALGKKLAVSKEKLRQVKVGAMVDRALRAGKLTPAQRDWALSCNAKTLRGYLKGAPQIAPTTPLTPKASTNAPNGRPVPSGGNPNAPIDAAIEQVARTMHLDPAKVAAHAEELRKAGVLH